MYSAIFSLRLLCAIYIGSVVWFNVRQAKIPLFTQKRNRRPGDKTIRTTFPTRANKPDKSDGGPASTPNRQSNPNDHPDRTKRTGQVRRRFHPDRRKPRSGSGRTKRHGASSPPRHLPFHQPPKEPAGASFPRISRSLGTADGFPELSQPARHTNIPRLTSTTSIPAAMPQRTPHRKRRQNADGR